ncbi:hypothetical protein [Nonomuraea recticatena]|uniref:Uncharacterized protein n=1 Tax=Nonomuraea recticatena TaxID=46178 RepID=A0ABP6ECH5_9ACTN
MTVKVVKPWKYGYQLEFEGVQFDVTSPPGCTPNGISWMSDWGVLRDWINRGLVTEKFIPNSYNDADQIWSGPMPE